MHKYRSFVISIFLAVVLSANPAVAAAATQAADAETEEQLSLEQSAEYLKELADFLLNNYVGENLTAEQLYSAAAQGMTRSLDQYTELLSADEYEAMLGGIVGNFKGIGIQMKMDLDGSVTVQKVFDSSPAKTAGIQKGDIILSVNGKEVSGYTDESLSEMIAGIDGEIKLEIMRGTQKLSKTMEKAEIQMTTVEYGKLGDFLAEAKSESKLGYIAISQIGERTADEVQAAITALKASGVTGVVIDLRGNLGGLKSVIEDISRMLVPKGTIFSTIDNASRRATYTSTLETLPFKKICILVDGSTASASELFASAMQDAKAAVIIGSNTYGKGVIQSFVGLTTGDILKYTSMEYMRRSGDKLNGIGITPDIVVEMPAALASDVFILHNDGTGSGVPRLKAILKYIGYKIKDETTLYDNETKAAVKDLQRRAKLNQTGQLDLETVKAINNALAIYRETHDEELKTALAELRK